MVQQTLLALQPNMKAESYLDSITDDVVEISDLLATPARGLSPSPLTGDLKQ